MQIKKNKIGSLEKCYSVSLFPDVDGTHLLVASEKRNQCRMYSLDGALEKVIWDEPGGTMSITPVPGRAGQFLASQRMFSPDDSKEAGIVSVTHEGDAWHIQPLAGLPHVHRFDILRAKDGTCYLIACTIKSGSEYDEDWRFPGAVYGAKLPEDVLVCDRENPLPLTLVKSGMYHNHGYWRHEGPDGDEAVVCSDEGVFVFAPPSCEGADWEIRQIADMPVSDAVLVDLDGDGSEELLIIAPFHGDTLAVCKWNGERYEKVYEHPEKMGFLHAICPGYIDGKPCVYVGHRKGDRNLYAVVGDGELGYRLLLLDRDVGPANCVYYKADGVDKLLSANRETDEIAIYEFFEK